MIPEILLEISIPKFVPLICIIFSSVSYIERSSSQNKKKSSDGKQSSSSIIPLSTLEKTNQLNFLHFFKPSFLLLNFLTTSQSNSILSNIFLTFSQLTKSDCFSLGPSAETNSLFGLIFL